jgi:hypothetical protein
MRVGNRLAGSLANIDTDVVAVRHAPRFDVTPNCRNKSPNAGLFLTGEGEEIGLVSPRNNQAMSLIQRISVGKRHGEIVRSKVISASEPVTEDTIQFASPRYPRPPGKSLWRPSSDLSIQSNRSRYACTDCLPEGSMRLASPPVPAERVFCLGS